MSFELPETMIITEQMSKELLGKKVTHIDKRFTEKMVSQGMVNKNPNDFDEMIGNSVKSVVSRGITMKVQFTKDMNLIIAPEYGGVILLHKPGVEFPKKYHLAFTLKDNSILSIQLKSWGNIFFVPNSKLNDSYVYRRDFSDCPTPLDAEMTFDRFSELIVKKNSVLKPMLVGKDAVMLGIQNSAFQDIIFRAKLHPKRRTFDLSDNEKRALYDAIRNLIVERRSKGGKDQFVDLYGVQGRYVPLMGPNMRDKKCRECGTPIERLAHGGGHVHLCPKCQPLN